MHISPEVKAIGVGTAIAMFVYGSGFLVILTPLPLFYVSAVYGRRWGLWAAGIAAIAVTVVYSIGLPAAGTTSTGTTIPIPGAGLAGFLPREFLMLLGVGYFLFFESIALMLGEGIHRRWELLHWGGMTLLVAFAVIACISFFSIFLNSGKMIDGLETYIGQIINQIVELNEEVGNGGSNMALLADKGEQIAKFMVRIMPSLVFVFTLLAVVINFLLGRRIIKKRRSFAHVHNVARFKLPDNFVWAVILAGGAFFIDHYVMDTGWLGTIAMNCLIGLLALYFFQGLSVIAYFLQGVRMPLMRTLVYVLIILFFQTISLIVVTLGIADVWVNFRLRRWRARHPDT